MAADSERARGIAQIQAWIDEGLSEEEIGQRFSAEKQSKIAQEGDYPIAESKFSEPPTSIVGTAGKWLKTGVRKAADFAHALAGGAAEATFGPVQNRVRAIGDELLQEEANLRGGPPTAGQDFRIRHLRKDLASVQGTQKAIKESPIVAGVGGLAAGFLSPGARAAQGVKTGGSVVRRMAAEGAGALLDVGVQAARDEKEPLELRDEAALSLLMSTIPAAAAEKLGALLRDNRGQAGKYIEALKRGEGFLASDDAKKLDKGISGIGQVAEDEGRKLGQLQADKLKLSKDTLGAAESAIQGADEVIDVAPVHAGLDKSVTRFSNDNPHRPDVQKAIGKGIKPNLQRPFSTPIKRAEDVGGDFMGYLPAGEPTVAPYATPADLLAQRRLARDAADFGTPRTPENAPYREIYGTLAGATHSPDLPQGIGGKFQAMDEQFSGDMEKLEKANELIIGRADPRAVTESVRAGEAAASKLSQALMDTKAGGAKSRLLEDIRALGPEYAEAVDRVSAKIAWNATRFGAPRVFSHSGKWYLMPLIQNLEATKVRLAEPLTRKAGVQAGAAGRLAPMLRDPIEALMNRKRKTEEEK